MSQNKFINVMISSRNDATFDGDSLTKIRHEIKELIEKEKVFGKQIFKVWINEDEPPQSFDETIWNKCLKEARQADIVIVLNNGQAGWLKPDDTIGICHAELLAAVNAARGKVWPITLENSSSEKQTEAEVAANEKFQEFIRQQQLFTKPIKTIASLKSRIKTTMQDAIIHLIEKGVTEVSRSKGNHGEALYWKRMNYDARSSAILKSLKESIDKKGTGYENNKYYFLKHNDYKILVVLHAIPDAFSVASARERVGQPFLDDFKLSSIVLEDDNIIGPIHIIGCHKTVTETQARNTLGFPDATILKDSFGIYVADNIQKIQMIFIEKCSDSNSTNHGFQELIDWLLRTSEIDELIKRAESRKNIITAIAREN